LNFQASLSGCLRKQWKLMKQCYMSCRVTYIPPRYGELYYMRILLSIQKGCIDYDSIKIVNGKTFETYEQPCYALGLLINDKEFIDAIKEASKVAFESQLRRLFVTLLVMITMFKPDVVCNVTWKLLSDGVLYQRRK